MVNHTRRLAATDPSIELVSPESTEFPSNWKPRKMKLGGYSIRTAKAPSGVISADWFVSREKTAQRCKKTKHWMEEFALLFLGSIRQRHGEKFVGVAYAVAKNGDAVFAALTQEENLADESFCGIVSASDVPPPCEGCQIQAAAALINVRSPEKTSLRQHSKTN